jgi:N-methylhydantoinase B
VCLDDRIVALACNRAHHADVGGITSGSMPISTSIFHEGLRIPPIKWFEAGIENESVTRLLLANVRTPEERLGDLRAQRAANAVGTRAVHELVTRYGVDTLDQLTDSLLDYAERTMQQSIATVPDGTYRFTDFMDNDGVSDQPVGITAEISVGHDRVLVDFKESSPQVPGCINCPASVTRSAVYYVFAALAGERLPLNAGAYRPIEISIPKNCLLNAQFPAAVVAGNVETSQRVVDVIIGALAQAIPRRVCAAGAGTMNSTSLGGIDPATDKPFTYYETIGGGMGAYPGGCGESAVQTHMTNTMNTPTEALEMAFPLRVHRYAIAEKTGGAGDFTGGNGIVREMEALTELDGALLADRHRTRPWGLGAGQPGAAGSAAIICKTGEQTPLASKSSLHLRLGDRLRITTPGGGGVSLGDTDA